MKVVDITEMSEEEIFAAVGALQAQMPKREDCVESVLFHIKDIYPTCTKVLFDNCGRWRYMDANNQALVFDKPVDVDLLEMASDSLVEVPALFVLN